MSVKDKASNKYKFIKGRNKWLKLILMEFYTRFKEKKFQLKMIIFFRKKIRVMIVNNEKFFKNHEVRDNSSNPTESSNTLKKLGKTELLIFNRKMIST